MSVISVLLLGMAISVDGLGVGFSYGLRKVHIPPLSLFIICCSSAVSIFFSMLAGRSVAEICDEKTAALLGGMMLMTVGIFLIRQAAVGKKESTSSQAPAKHGLALLPAILREPEKADFDRSGEINPYEAVILGIALALDAFGTGFSAAMLGFSPFAVALAAGLTKFIFLSAGLLLGKQCTRKFREERASVVAGVILMLLGIKYVLS